MEVKVPRPSPGFAAQRSCGGQWPHTGRGELAQAPAVPRPWHVPRLSPVLALAWLEEQSQSRAGSPVSHFPALTQASIRLVPCCHSRACGRGTGGHNKPWGTSPSALSSRLWVEHVPALAAWPGPFSLQAPTPGTDWDTWEPRNRR